MFQFQISTLFSKTNHAKINTIKMDLLTLANRKYNMLHDIQDLRHPLAGNFRTCADTASSV